ncbi:MULTISPECIES: protein translocase subunit SecF [Nitrosomonas]|uniref:Protein-export membrane protein SecF n=1 Tax=Nitrosomonas communis TaxID=44574 RepID=A0A0F7KEY5_9PROT|nr:MULTISPECIES: protein translocase subunit SecF [Nitrosomonas]AKH37364.1 preprotein translocase subunit SecF [Nitrosomonas communis]TYP78297.1 preprotein translocase subunit SecF [Nitrosomonas communis]UVS62589.1 protein translocase subunit SecF [Nitrosomonas sp. PLL12]
MEFFKFERDIPFMSWGKYTTTISLLTFAISLFFIVTKGLNLGVDFTGGTVLEVSYAQPANLDRIRSIFVTLGIPDASVQNFGTSRDVLIRLPAKHQLSSAKLSETVIASLKELDESIQIRRVEFVGPQVGDELLENGALALLFVSLGIVAYLAMRFEWKFGVAGIIANLHDVIIILGFFAYFQWEFSLTVLAAILAVLGYSVNESVVVFDRIRENFRKMRKAPATQIINNAITRTMSRTIITHGSTEAVVVSMLLFGGETLYYFALALTIGILFGIYSSVLVASPLLMLLGVKREDLVKPEKKQQEEALP